MTDMKKLISLLLAIILLAPCFSGCGERNLPDERPDDFSFTLTWGTYGISSYDSRTGKLVKTREASNPKDYVTYVRLSEEELDFIYQRIRKLRVDSYPDEYDPDPFVTSIPHATLIITVRTGDYEKTINADDVSLAYEAIFPKGKRFINTLDSICHILVSTEEWKALPDYEFYYD